MVYREAYGGEIRTRRFLDQYRGKGEDDPLMPSRDIRNITGATLSARAVGRAVKKAIAVLEVIGDTPAEPKSTMTPSAKRPEASPARVREAHYVMGTLLEITLDAPDEEAGRAWLRRAVGEARRLDAELSSFRADSALCELNRSAGMGPQRVPADLFRLLEQSRELSDASGGTFDVTIAPLAQLWMVEILRLSGVKSALINFGGSSIAALGPPGEEPGWPVWVEYDGALRGPMILRDMALSTSNSLGKDEHVPGRRIGHIVDPRTGRALRRAAQATVFAPSATEAEAWSKALLVDPPLARKAMATRRSVSALFFVGSRELPDERFAALSGWTPSRP
jgi:thiamine biosynthesis lipoprotein ApbE